MRSSASDHTTGRDWDCFLPSPGVHALSIPRRAEGQLSTAGPELLLLLLSDNFI